MTTGATVPRPLPPVAPVVPATRRFHGADRIDPYAWLQDREAPAVLKHLAAENAYTDAVLASLRVPPAVIERETRARTPAEDCQVPVPCGPYLYFLRTLSGMPGLLHCRRPREGGADEIMLDENALARDMPGARVLTAMVSPDQRLLLVAVDSYGDERCILYLKHLESGLLLPDIVAAAAAEIAWCDDRSFLYLLLDDANRPFRLCHHRLGGGEAILYEETDPVFHLSLRRSESGAFAFVSARGAETTEILWLATEDACKTPAVLVPRAAGSRAYATHWRDRFVILTDERAEMFRLAQVETADPRRSAWRVLLPERPGIELRHVQAFAEHLVVHERSKGKPHIAVIDAHNIMHRVALPEAVRSVHCGDNREFQSAVLRFGYESPVTPYRVYDYHLDARVSTMLRQNPVAGFDPADYAIDCLYAPARDGTRVPITLLRPVASPVASGSPLVLTAYGSYGASLEPEFSAMRLCLLERGIAFAIAHVRGGGELGPHWHRAGMRQRKPNAIDDLISCAEHLSAMGFGPLGLLGQSAGGLVVTAAMNARPDLFAAVVGDVPFVDPIGTLADDTLPFTMMDRGEWGDPLDPEAYRILREIAPYDNVRPAAYPAVLLTAGWNDPRIGYWEPAKLAARLRAANTGNAEILLRTRMGGHTAAGSDEELAEWAALYAFLIDRLGAN